MKPFEIQMTLERIRDARRAATEAHSDINAQARRSMRRLLIEAATNRMSVDEVAKYSGYPKARIREMMRNEGLDPKWSKTLLAAAAAEALAENAELLGIDPVDMDLTSPLAYLPAGDQLRRAVETTRGVYELSETRWWIEEIRQGVDVLHEVYAGEADEPLFIATFNDKAEAERVVALVNGVHETEDERAGYIAKALPVVAEITECKGATRDGWGCSDCRDKAARLVDAILGTNA